MNDMKELRELIKAVDGIVPVLRRFAKRFTLDEIVLIGKLALKRDLAEKKVE